MGFEQSLHITIPISEVFRRGIAPRTDISLGGSHVVGGDGRFDDVGAVKELANSVFSKKKAGGEGDARSLRAISKRLGWWSWYKPNRV